MYWILLIFLLIGLVYPAIGFIAVICMVGPMVMAVSRGRYWCGHVCPRGNFYDRLMGRVSKHRSIPAVFRQRWFRALMICFIFLVFGVQMSLSWGDVSMMGGVFVEIILFTTIAGMILAVLYHERTWCSFCPMGSLSALVSPREKKTVQSKFQVVAVGSSCVGCKLCRKVCPMQLKPDEVGKNAQFIHEDCLKCGKCAAACPKGALRLE